ncbi:MAG: hypothetical protein PWR27_153 [Petroclostridium sp.]|jgi:hypothetical protein|nr:hypothetical protein [Petroclostridium xylanilyticum]MBZ4646994.1 hypothetical protein [Clostridia bacterium]MDK2809444.1 hypothetical protein [Petroclostridium sp.]
MSFFSNLFDNDEILWFIILFLLLFWGFGGYGYGYGCTTKSGPAAKE